MTAILRSVIRIAALPLAVVLITGFSAAAAHASTRFHAYRVARAQIGCSYVWAAAGPCGNGFDCSGLVMFAYARVGAGLPHNTVAMLDSGKLRRVRARDRRVGDLAFFGDGHVELVTGRHSRWTLGALEPGTRVSYHHWNSFWHPTGFYHVRGTG